MTTPPLTSARPDEIAQNQLLSQIDLRGSLEPPEVKSCCPPALGQCYTMPSKVQLTPCVTRESVAPA